MEKELRPGIIVMFSGFAGVILAAIEKMLYDDGVLNNDYTTAFGSIVNVMILTIVVAILLGIVIGMAFG